MSPSVPALLLLLPLVACSPARTPEQEAARQACLLQAELAADASIDAQCAGFTYDTCPDAPNIMNQLQKDQEACR